MRILRHYIPGSFLLLLIIESCILMASLAMGVQLSIMFELGSTHDIKLDWWWPRATIFTIINISSMTFMGLYWRHRKESELIDFIVRVSISFAIGIAMISLVFYAFPGIAVDRSVMFFAVTISLVLMSLTRLMHYQISDHQASRSRVLIVGTGKKAQLIQQLRRKSDLYGTKIVGYVYIAGENSKIPEDKITVLGGALIDYVQEHQIDEIVVAVDDRRRSFPVDEILECKMDGLEIYEAGDFIERQIKKIRLDTLHPSSMIFSDGYTSAVLDSFSKRIFDIFASVMLLIVASPVMIITALSIWMESGFKGTLIYRQERVGKNGQLFNVLKFRSMKEDAEKGGVAQWAQKNDDRVTANGKVIRMLRIDELPQLFNVLMGDMSFVGPRPERPQFVKQLSQVIPFYNLRHYVKPGITGWAQICYPYGASEQDAIEKLQYDLFYIKRYSIMFDMVILFQTAQAVLWSRGGR